MNFDENRTIFSTEEIMRAAQAAGLFYTDLSFGSGQKDTHAFYPYRGRVEQKLVSFLQNLFGSGTNHTRF